MWPLEGASKNALSKQLYFELDEQEQNRQARQLARAEGLTQPPADLLHLCALWGTGQRRRSRPRSRRARRKALNNVAGLTSPALYRRRREEVLWKTVSVLVAAAMLSAALNGSTVR